MSIVLERMAPTDGRWLRALRTRNIIIDAWLELLHEGDLSPTAKDVAARANVGLRTIFGHFSDMVELHLAARYQLISNVRRGAMAIPRLLSLDERILVVTALRAEAWDTLSMFRRASEQRECYSSAIHEMIDSCERGDALSTMRAFSAEFQAQSPEGDPTLKMAVDGVLSWSHWNHLRLRRQLDSKRAQAVIRYSLHSLLGGGFAVTSP